MGGSMRVLREVVCQSLSIVRVGLLTGHVLLHVLLESVQHVIGAHLALFLLLWFSGILRIGLLLLGFMSWPGSVLGVSPLHRVDVGVL